MERYSGVFVWGCFFLIIMFVVYYFAQGFLLSWKIKKDPVYVDAIIDSIYPRKPNDLGKVDIVINYHFFTPQRIEYKNNNQTLNINTLDLEKYPRGGKVPVVYNRSAPQYNQIDYYAESLSKQ